MQEEDINRAVKKLLEGDNKKMRAFNMMQRTKDENRKEGRRERDREKGQSLEFYDHVF